MPWSISPYLRHSIQAADPVIAMTAKRGKKNRVQAQSLPHSNGKAFGQYCRIATLSVSGVQCSPYHFGEASIWELSTVLCLILP
jgi:hypothetical protein